MRRRTRQQFVIATFLTSIFVSTGIVYWITSLPAQNVTATPLNNQVDDPLGLQAGSAQAATRPITMPARDRGNF